MVWLHWDRIHGFIGIPGVIFNGMQSIGYITNFLDDVLGLRMG